MCHVGDESVTCMSTSIAHEHRTPYTGTQQVSVYPNQFKLNPLYLFDQHAGARFEQVVALEGRLAEEEFVGEHPEGPEVDAWSVPTRDEMRTRGHERVGGRQWGW